MNYVEPEDDGGTDKGDPPDPVIPEPDGGTDKGNPPPDEE